MNIKQYLKNNTLLFDAPIETRLMYEKKIQTPEDFSTFQNIYIEENQAKLAELYRDDIATTQELNKGILLNIPTFRASPRYLENNGFNASETGKVNQDAYAFVDNIRKEFKNPTAPIYIIGPVGPKHDAYRADLSISIEEAKEYHHAQISALNETSIDLINIAMMPSIDEAIGAAMVANELNANFTISFAIDSEGKLMNGTPLHEAIQTIDEVAAPLHYMIFCTHPSTAKQALANWHDEYNRIIGIKANGSCKTPEELDNSGEAHTDPAEPFAEELLELKHKYDWRIIGGCCGTSRDHLAVITKLL